MKTTAKILAFLLVGVLTLSLYVACDSGSEQEFDRKKDSETHTTSGETEEDNAGTTPDTDSGRMRLASSEEADYMLYIPDGWLGASEEGLTTAIAHAESGGSCTINMKVDTESDQTDVAGYWESKLEETTRYFTSDDEGNAAFKMITDGEEYTLDGAPARIYRYEGSILGVVTMRYMQVIAYHNEAFYVFIYDAADDDYAERETDASMMLDKFKFKY